jgi:molybdenum cofactor sulfurtransferase
VIGLAPNFARQQGFPLEECVSVKTPSEILSLMQQDSTEDGLFAYTAQCNFSGERFPLDWVTAMQSKRMKVLLDAASYASTTALDLSTIRPEFVVLSFYKMFGYPTGLGALVLRNDQKSIMIRSYFGGGTVSAIAVNPLYLSMKDNLSHALEDGTLPFQQIIALDAGFDYIERKWISWSNLYDYCSELMLDLVRRLECLKHHNNSPVVRVYRDEAKSYGPILAFNLLNPVGDYIGYSEVMRLAGMCNIHLRAGRFCNPGGAQYYLELTSEKLMEMREAFGHVCGDANDLIGGQPTGALRISLGFCNTPQDITVFMQFLEDYFVQSQSPTRPFNEPLSLQFDIKAIYIYPIKSCGGISVRDWPFAVHGLLYDRHFMLIDDEGHVMTQRKFPKLKQIRIEQLCRITKQLSISAPGMPLLTIPLLGNGSCVETKLCNTLQLTKKVNMDIQSWFERFLGTKCQFVRVHDAQTSFVNKAQFLLVNDSSILELKRRITGDSEHIGTHSFRPNFVIDTTCPFEENEWIGKVITVGRYAFKVKEHCERCQVVGVDLKGGKHAEPLLTLAKQRVKVQYFNPGKNCIRYLFGFRRSEYAGNAHVATFCFPNTAMRPSPFFCVRV